jgi:4-amino-4-deoxy-L-arabinose transferase-like glycosyltransferase
VLRRCGPIAIALGLYCLWGFLLISQKPGLQYDEAMLVAGAVHLAHSAGPFDLQRTPDAWVCPLDRCFPLMSAYYVGSVKEYAALPFFALFGARTTLVRLVSLLLSAIGIWGIFMLIAERFDRRAAAIAACLIAINPAFADMTVFDNGAFGAMMAGLGLTCAAIANYDRRKSFWSAFALGAAMGFGVWARANYVWLLIAGAVAALIVFRRQILIPARHWIAILLGGIIGGSPFLAFQILSNGATWRVQEAFSVSTSIATLLRQRAFLLADTLLSDGEHRVMWAGPPLPEWQLWLFPAVVIAACLICLLGSRSAPPRQRSFARALALAFLFLAALLFLSRLQVAEHHLVILVPFAAAMAAVAGSMQAQHRWALAASAGLLLIYVSSAVYWQMAAVRGLRDSGGIGVWSDAGLQLARYLDQNCRGREVKFLDWGLQYNMYVVTDGRLKSREIDAPASEERSFAGRPWIDEIRDGGVFALNGPDNRQFPKPSAGFLHALAVTRPVMHTYSIAQRGGQSYAEVIEIQPDSIRGPAHPGEESGDRIRMGDTHADTRLTGFYPPDQGFRWTKREFSARLDYSLPDATGVRLAMQLYIPAVAIQRLGHVTLRARVGGQALRPETWSQPGGYAYCRDLDAAQTAAGPIQVDFALDKSIPPGPDPRELGIVVTEISLEPR